MILLYKGGVEGGYCGKSGCDDGEEKNISFRTCEKGWNHQCQFVYIEEQQGQGGEIFHTWGNMQGASMPAWRFIGV
jgi:hypothetical protein